jgi:hypothetical protein
LTLLEKKKRKEKLITFGLSVKEEKLFSMKIIANALLMTFIAKDNVFLFYSG